MGACPECGGRGYFYRIDCNDPVKVTCPRCGGTGRVKDAMGDYPPGKSLENLAAFKALVHKIPIDEEAEGLVRKFMEGIARSCPKDLLVRLAELVAEYRHGELQEESSGN